jgi:hypothetical protein
VTTTPAAGQDQLELEGTATLIGYGRISWADARLLLTGAEAAWADYEGFHIGPPPQTPPPYSHLWAWTGQWLARLRIDDQTAIVGVLALTAAPASGPPGRDPLPVSFSRSSSSTWPSNEKRVGPLLAGVHGRTADLYQVTGEYPITFVRVRPAVAIPG